MITPPLITFQSALLIVDVQKRLLLALSDPSDTLESLRLLQKSAQELQVPTFCTLQNLAKLGEMPGFLEESQAICFHKMSFNALMDVQIREMIENHPATQWIVAGLEAHICVLQTAKELARMGKQVVVAADACASLGIYDYASAISEMRYEGIRITTVQTIVFEWMKSCEHPSFPTILSWVKQQASRSCSEDACESEAMHACCGGLEENGYGDFTSCCQGDLSENSCCGDGEEFLDEGCCRSSDLAMRLESMKRSSISQMNSSLGRSDGQSHDEGQGHRQGGCCQGH